MDKVFKYYDLKDEYTLKNLTHCVLYFNKPSNFNDPFDSYFEFDWTGSIEDWEDFLVSNEFPKELAILVVKEIVDGELPTNCIFSSKEFNKTYSKLSVTCFCEEPDNILFWSHYAKKHTGICIGFRVYPTKTANFIILEPRDLKQYNEHIPEGIVPLYKVKYSAEMPQPYKYFNDDPTRLIDFINTKSDHWTYEKEHRAVMPFSCIVNNPVHFDPKLISDIIFGINTDEADIQRVKKIIGTYPSSGNWIKLFKCERERGKYKIKLVPI